MEAPEQLSELPVAGPVVKGRFEVVDHLEKIAEVFVQLPPLLHQ